tara:strand:- start:714 stop:866 length:153 start_codon:yes stop_codon:yes gene_type:complete
MVWRRSDFVIHRGWGLLLGLVHIGVVLLCRDHERHGPSVFLAQNKRLELN